MFERPTHCTNLASSLMSYRSALVLRSLRTRRASWCSSGPRIAPMRHQSCLPAAAPSLGAQFEDPQGQLVFERHGSSEGDFHFTSNGEGEYKLCFTAKGEAEY